MLRSNIVVSSRIRGVLLPPRRSIVKPSIKHDSEVNTKHILDVYTDASLARNPHRAWSDSNRGIGLGVYMLDDVRGEIRVAAKKSKRDLSMSSQLDVNFGELLAILLGLHISPMDAPIAVHSDSDTALEIIFGHQRTINGKYQSVASEISRVLDSRTSSTYITKVKAHSNVHGNEVADGLARVGALTDDDDFPYVVPGVGPLEGVHVCLIGGNGSPLTRLPMITPPSR